MAEKQPHKTIYLQWGNHADWESLTWCQDRINDDDVEYVRKDVYNELKAELKTERKNYLSASKKVHTLRAELAALKPDWKDAPEHAYSLVARWWWQNKNNEYFKPVQAGIFVEYRPGVGE